MTKEEEAVKDKERKGDRQTDRQTDTERERGGGGGGGGWGQQKSITHMWGRVVQF